MPALPAPEPSRAAGWWIFAAAAGAAVTTLGLWAWFWPGAIPSGTTSGVWTALADDLAHGIFYRPLHTGGEFGGTRYAPLFFSLHGALIALGCDAVRVGATLTFLSAAWFDGAVFRLLRLQGVARGPALAWTALGHASLFYQLATLEIRGDLLAAAAGLWGAGLAWRRGDGKISWGACACFAVAITTKLTAVVGLAVVLLPLLRRREWRTGAGYVAGTGALVAAAAAATHVASGGRVWAVLGACAWGGGGWGHAALAPWWLGRTLAEDPYLWIPLLVAVACAWARRDRAALLLAVAGVALLPVFATPGTGGNHFFEVLGAMLVVLGGSWTANPARGIWKILLGVLVAGFLATWLGPVPSLRSWIAAAGRPTRATAEKIAALTAGDARPVLSENPLLPVLAGQRAAVLDAFSLRVLAGRDPAVARDFTAMIAGEKFSAVVLLDWSGAPESKIEAALAAHAGPGGEGFYGAVHFPPGFLEILHAHYALAAVERPYVVFRPRGR